MCRWRNTVLALLAVPTVYAHDPVFGVGPHVLFKDGIEISLAGNRMKSSERQTETELEIKYGITGDWVAGIGTGYARTESAERSNSGRAPTSISTKYRFWRNDMFTAQESTAVFGKIILNDGRNNGVDLDGKDYLLGFSYGYEGRKWYRWASARHRFNSDTALGTERPNIWLLDLATGIRFSPTEYLEPDWVWILELNGEMTKDPSQGGGQWFVSPGLMWTYRNVAAKAGVQLHLLDDLAKDRESDDYRAMFELEWHL